VRGATKRLGWELRTLAGRSPLLTRILLRRSGEVVTSETEICIEGFPRSGNTFAVIAFQQAQSRTVSIAHHVHAPGSALIAVRMGKPALILIRSPQEAVLSMVIRYPHLSIRQVLRGYVRFYLPLWRVRDRLVVGRFKDVVGDLGGVIREVDERFDVDFEPFIPSEENLASVREELDRWDLNTFGSGEDLERGRARPSPKRELMKEDLLRAYQHPRLSRLRTRAERLHEAFVYG
jgi:hypothetical protein